MTNIFSAANTQKLSHALLLIVFGLIPLHALLTTWLGSYFFGYQLIIKSWKEIIMLAVLSLLLVAIIFTPRFRQLLTDRLMVLIILYATLHVIIAVVFSQNLNTALAGLIIDLRYLLFFSLVFIFLRLAPQLRKTYLKVGLAAASLVIIFGVLQATVLPADILKYFGYSDSTISPYLTVDKNPDLVRINSTLRGPNPLGIYVGMAVTLALSFILYGRRLSHKLKLGLVSLGVGGLIVLYATYSRSAAAAAFISLFLASAPLLKTKTNLKRLAIAGLAVVVVVTGIVVTRSELVGQLVFHDNPNGGSLVDSNQEHAQSLSTSVGKILKNPFGEGVGSTGSASLLGNQPVIVESQYLFVAHEVGLLGLGLFLAIFGLVLWRLWLARSDWLARAVFASGVGIAVAGLVLPVYADDTVSLVWWGLAAIALATIKGKKQI